MPPSWKSASRAFSGAKPGAVGQGIGPARHDHVADDPGTGQLLTGSLVHYALPRADHLPEIESRFIEMPCRNTPLGAKGAGKADAIAAPAAVMNALMDALAPAGATRLDMPATPLALWQALRHAKQRE